MIDYLEWLLENQEESRMESDEAAAELFNPAQNSIVRQAAAKTVPNRAAALRQSVEANLSGEAVLRQPVEASLGGEAVLWQGAEAGNQTGNAVGENAGTIAESAASITTPSAWPQAGEILSAMLQLQNNALGRNGSRAWARKLYRESVTAAHAAVTLRQGSGRTLRVTEPTAAAPAPSAAQLDELFARDARRYDGGFSMY